MERQEKGDHWDQPDLPESLVSGESLARQDLLDHLELVESGVNLDSVDNQEHPVRLDHRERLGLLDHRDREENKEKEDHKAQLVSINLNVFKIINTHIYKILCIQVLVIW